MTRPTRPSRLSLATSRQVLALQASLARFRREEDGTLTVFGLYLTILILMLGGIAVDVMRAEQVRTAVQNVEDTAVLAATNLDQTLDAEAVVKDYFAKAGMSDYLKSVKVTTALNSKEVQAIATTDVNTYFMKLEGINTIGANIPSTAQESIGHVEVALALDNSGSMNEQAVSGSYEQCTTKKNRSGSYQSCRTVYTYTSKIAALQTAANQFVDTMFSQVEPGALTMSILPYDSHVDIGNELLADLNVTTNSDLTPTKCVENSSLDFTTPAISPTATLVRVPYYDPGYSTNYGSVVSDCNFAASRDSAVFATSATPLHTLINSFSASGNTSIDTGVKWAAATLDPAFQPVVTDMIAKNEITSDYAGVPAAYGDRTRMKVLIVMSDGENTTRYDLASAYRSGNAPVWYNATVGGLNGYSVYNPSSGKYYSLKYNSWLNKPYGQNAGDQGSAVQQTYPQLWAKMSTLYYAYYVYGAAFGSSAGSNLWNQITSTTDSTTMDSSLHTICAAAKSQGVLIYAIGFQTTSHGASTLQDCATAPAYYFDAQGTEISNVFSMIAASIQHLRLTQ